MSRSKYTILRIGPGQGRSGHDRGLSLAGSPPAMMIVPRVWLFIPAWLIEARIGFHVMRLALMIEGQEGVTWEEWVALASACEEHGVEALFRSDHYLSGFDENRPALDAWTTIAGLAARTTRLELGTLVSPATFRHPSVLARGAATADEISVGRVTLGMGAGWMEREHVAYGFEFGTS